MAKPDPKFPPGVNSQGRTYQEQMDYEAKQRWIESQKDKPAPTPLKKGQTYKVMKGSPNMAKIVATKKAAEKAKKKKAAVTIPASPTK